MLEWEADGRLGAPLAAAFKMSASTSSTDQRPIIKISREPCVTSRAVRAPVALQDRVGCDQRAMGETI